MPWVDLPTSRQYGRTIALNGNWPRITVNFEDSYVDVDIQEREGGSWQEATLDELPNNAIHFLFERPRPLEGRQVAPRGPFAAEGAVDHWQEEGAVETLPEGLADLVENALGLGVRLGAYIIYTPSPREINPSDPDWNWLSYVQACTEGLHRVSERERYFWENPATERYEQADVLRAIHAALVAEPAHDRIGVGEMFEALDLEASVGSAFDQRETLGFYADSELSTEYHSPLGNNWTEPEYRRATAGTQDRLSLFEQDFRDNYGPELHSQLAVTEAILVEIYERRRDREDE